MVTGAQHRLEARGEGVKHSADKTPGAEGCEVKGLQGVCFLVSSQSQAHRYDFCARRLNMYLFYKQDMRGTVKGSTKLTGAMAYNKLLQGRLRFQPSTLEGAMSSGLLSSWEVCRGAKTAEAGSPGV
eukprot:1159386-Pelagomonas_calceolata.AAC.2